MKYTDVIVPRVAHFLLWWESQWKRSFKRIDRRGWWSGFVTAIEQCKRGHSHGTGSWTKDTLRKIEHPVWRASFDVNLSILYSEGNEAFERLRL